jgi:hypothetical protein
MMHCNVEHRLGVVEVSGKDFSLDLSRYIWNKVGLLLHAQVNFPSLKISGRGFGELLEADKLCSHLKAGLCIVDIL